MLQLQCAGKTLIKKELASAVCAALASIAVLIVVDTALVSSSAALAINSPEVCENDGDVSYICDVINVEDLIHIEGTNWVLAGSLPERGQTAGGFYLMDSASEFFTDLVPDFSAQVAPEYAACPGSPDPTRFLVHGINIKFSTSGVHDLYVVNHGERESVEIFKLDSRSELPTLTWNGCVIAPEEASLNSVAFLPSGGFATTSITTRTDPDSFSKLIAGQPSGFVLEWTPQMGWMRVPNSAFSGNNGIEVSKDGNALYVAGWADNSLHIIDRKTHTVESIDLGELQPDNIRYAADGSILIAGQVVDNKQAIFDCIRSDAAVCAFDYQVAKFNPATMELKTVVDERATEHFGGATTGVQLGDEIWVGTFRGNRVARVPLKN